MTSIDFTKRDRGIDHLRAITMVVMIFVNDFWKIHDVPHWLEHAKFGEDFLGLSDVVFPVFLFVVGMSIPYAIERRFSKGLPGESTVGHIFTRSFALLIMGAFIVNSESKLSPEVAYPIGVYWILMVTAFLLIWNQYPKAGTQNRQRIFSSLKWIGIAVLFYLAISFRDPKGGVFTAGWWGILGLIGWCYLFSAMIYVFTRDRLRYLVPIWIALVVICMLGTRLNEAHGGEAFLALPRPNFYNDLLNIFHVGNGALAAFTMGGIIFSLVVARVNRFTLKRKAAYLISAVVVLFIAGYISRNYWIVSKLSASPPWIFYVTAIAIVIYSLLSWLAQTGRDGWLNILSPAGTATLTCYLLPYVSYALADLTGISLPDWFTHQPWGLVNSFLFALLMVGITSVLGRMHIKLKI